MFFEGLIEPPSEESYYGILLVMFRRVYTAYSTNTVLRLYHYKILE